MVLFRYISLFHISVDTYYFFLFLFLLLILFLLPFCLFPSSFHSPSYLLLSLLLSLLSTFLSYYFYFFFCYCLCCYYSPFIQSRKKERKKETKKGKYLHSLSPFLFYPILSYPLSPPLIFSTHLSSSSSPLPLSPPTFLVLSYLFIS
jgi:hypothetical protein